MPSPKTFSQATQIAASGVDLSAEQTGDLIDQMLRGQASDDEIGQLLLALREKGESVSELVGAATAMRRHMTKIPHRHKVLLDTCGTGGSGSGTFNISTAVAIVAAACGVAVAKHGNRKATSLTGSADVLEELGVRIESDASSVAQRLDSLGICFCFAAKLHPAMRHVVSVRRTLGVKTLFNLLGPLCNPAGATHQLLGTSSSDAQAKIAAAVEQLGTRRSLILHASDSQDEVSLGGTTRAIEVSESGQQEHVFSADDFGLPSAAQESLAAANPAESATIIRKILAGQSGPCRDTVLAGTATALWLVGKVADLKTGVQLATQAIDEGAAQATLESLKEN